MPEKIYNKEADIETLGVELPDDKTIVFHLEKPCVYFLDLLRLPVYTPSCSKYAGSANPWLGGKIRRRVYKRSFLFG